MRLSREKLLAEASTTGFRAEVLERVVRLLTLLEICGQHPLLKTRLVLKGGTALNLFVFDVPRLSVDIDFNYVGAVDAAEMKAERPKIEEAVLAVCSREELRLRRMPTEHAGGKFRLGYDSALGQPANLEIDISFMLRVPLWSPRRMDSKNVGSYSPRQVLVADPVELAAGKLAALFSRSTSRDLFDSHQLLVRGGLDRKRLRLAFVVYGAMQRKDWRTVSADDVSFDLVDLERNLTRVLRAGTVPAESEQWAASMVEECRERLDVVLPFNEAERDFLDRLLDHGEIEPSLLTDDAEMADRVRSLPGLKWKALNVKRFRGKA